MRSGSRNCEKYISSFFFSFGELNILCSLVCLGGKKNAGNEFEQHKFAQIQVLCAYYFILSAAVHVYLLR